jgi:hypothetical protein
VSPNKGLNWGVIEIGVCIVETLSVVAKKFLVRLGPAVGEVVRALSSVCGRAVAARAVLSVSPVIVAESSGSGATERSVVLSAESAYSSTDEVRSREAKSFRPRIAGEM